MFDEVFPYYMLYGMSYDEFWHGDPWLCEYYRQYHRLCVEQRNQELWIQGLYNLSALSVALSGVFGSKGKKAKYIEKPFQLFPKTREEELAEAEETRRKLVEKLNRWKDDFERKQQKQGGS